ncbi:MAG: phosphoribosyltransferase [Chthoniobacterales bacterium]
MRRFKNRQEAGQLLALELAHYADRKNCVVLALPRGGVPVAHELSQALRLPLDILVVRKLGVPGHEELAMGAIASGGIRIINPHTLSALGISSGALAEVERRELIEMERRERIYRGNKAPLEVSEKTVILVDDGIATGATIRAAIASLHQRGARKIVVASPVAPESVVISLSNVAEEVICVLKPRDFGGVGWWYEDFSQTTDEEVRHMLNLESEPQSTSSDYEL